MNPELRKKRCEILSQIDKLEKRRCEKCTDRLLYGANAPKSFYECECEAAVEIRKLGEQLMKLITERMDPAEEFLKMQPDELTLEVYQEIKQAEFDGKKITDYAIARRYGINPKNFVNWKKREWGIETTKVS